jgi:hypothetical protein
MESGDSVQSDEIARQTNDGACSPKAITLQVYFGRSSPPERARHQRQRWIGRTTPRR